jgi:hypothetical protein
MHSLPIYFQFSDHKAALQAFDTLQELEYEVEWLEHDHKEHLPTLRLNVERSDLTSALEIAQSHGGTLIEAKPDYNEMEILTSAYDLESIAIPAHVVNGEEGFDPSEKEYDHFPAGVRL